eukprot:905767-Prymnesium_polylepis.1
MDGAGARGGTLERLRSARTRRHSLLTSRGHARPSSLAWRARRSAVQRPTRRRPPRRSRPGGRTRSWGATTRPRTRPTDSRNATNCAFS